MPGGWIIRRLSGTVGWGAGAYAALASLFHLYTAGYGVFEPRVQRSVHLLFLVPLVFLAFPLGKRSPRERPSAFDRLRGATSWSAARVGGAAGQTLPPVRGAGVFIMGEVPGISSFSIIKAAAIPAILYYVGL